MKRNNLSTNRFTFKELTVVLDRLAGDKTRYTARVVQQGADGPHYGGNLLAHTAIYSAKAADDIVRDKLRDIAEKVIIDVRSE